MSANIKLVFTIVITSALYAAPSAPAHGQGTVNRSAGEPNASPLLAAASQTHGDTDAEALKVSAGRTSSGSATSQISTSQGQSELEEVIVTARRREENLQAVPEQIVVISPGQLRDNNVQTLQDLQYLVPSFTAASSLSGDSLDMIIRGQGINASGIPGVVAYVNEVPLPFAQSEQNSGETPGGAGLLFDLENVQVLEGAQGTLFGRNTVGGALLLQTARPTNDFGGNVELSYGNYNNRQISGAVNIPIVDDVLLARIAITTQQRDGYTHVLSEPAFPTGVYANNVDYYGLRGTVTFRPNDRFQNDTIATYTASSNHGSPLILDAANSPLIAANNGASYAAPFPAYVAEQQALGPYTAQPIDTNLFSTSSLFATQNISRLNLTDKVTFRNILGVNRLREDYTADFDGTISQIGDAIYLPSDFTVIQYSEEAQLLGKSFGDRLNWVVGVFYVDEYSLYPEPLRQLGQPAYGGPFSQFLNYDSFSENSRAVYGQATYDLSQIVPNLKVTGGYRYTWDFDSAVLGFGFAQEPSGLTYRYFPASSSAPGWTLGLDEQITPDVLLYLASHRAYRNGGANTQNQVGSEPNFGPEYVTDGDVGIKSDWSVGSARVRINADMFYQQYTDQQNTIIVPGGSGGFEIALTVNAGTARLWGSEFIAEAQLTRDLTIGATFDYLNYTTTQFPPGSTAAFMSQVNAGNTHGRPPYKYGVNAKYRLPLSADAGDITVRANWNWQASQSLGIALPLVASQGDVMDSFGLLNLSLNWDKIGGSAFDASPFGANVLNKVYATSGYGFYNLVGYATERFGEPRMYGFRVRYRFGSEGRG